MACVLHLAPSSDVNMLDGAGARRDAEHPPRTRASVSHPGERLRRYVATTGHALREVSTAIVLY